jgi:hypothetical protein
LQEAYFLESRQDRDRHDSREINHIDEEERIHMFRGILTLFLSLCLSAAAPAAQAEGVAPAITEQEAQDIAVDAYLYFYSLVSMDVSRRQFTNGTTDFKSPMNTFLNIREYPPASFRGVVRSNFDTLYSSLWVDMTKEPVVISVPDTDGRYYLLPMLDMWTNVFASPGWRTTGTKAGTFLLTPTGWRPDLRDRFVDEFKLPKDTQRIEAPTPYVWVIGRTKTDGPADYDAVHKIQDGYKVTLLSDFGKAPKPVEFKFDPTVDMKTPPKVQVDTMAGGKFFAYAAELLKVNPPHITDEPILARMKRIGIEAGKSFDVSQLDPIVRKAIESAPETAQELMRWKIATIARVANGWSMMTDTVGVYGNYYLKRSIITQQGLGANLVEDAIYPLNLADSEGKALDGANKYVLHFDKDQTPPAYAFWSVTLYDAEGFQVGNVLNRFAVSSWMPFKYNADGSLDLYFQNESPGKDKEANWLPAPKGPFNLTMRLYAPKSEALTGKWNPPPVVRMRETVGLSAQ